MAGGQENQSSAGPSLQDVIETDDQKIDSKQNVSASDLAGTAPVQDMRDFLETLCEKDGQMFDSFQKYLDERPQRQAAAAETEAADMQYDDVQVAAANGDDAQMDEVLDFQDEFISMAKHVPLRLTFDERRILRLMESALLVSEYTDKIDISQYASNRKKRMVAQIKNMCAILSGLFVAQNYEQGKLMLKDSDFAENEEFFKMCFEIGRRYKVVNPERMRDTYGKLIYLLMDSQKEDIKDLLDFDCVVPVRTVFETLKLHKAALGLLEDPLLKIAVGTIRSEGKARYEVDKQIRMKNQAVKKLAEKYSTVRSTRTGTFFRGVGYSFGLYSRSSYEQDDDDDKRAIGQDGLTEDDIEQCIYSLGDHATYLEFNRDPCVKMLRYLDHFFKEDEYEEGLSLAISSGRGGARLSHGHARQFQYVKQTLILWKHVLGSMFLLWDMAERDLLDPEQPYRLRDTGQGLQRVQHAGRVSEKIHAILRAAQKEAGGWVGSSMIHLGDHNVPNALMFIDKYTQVPRILAPLCTAIRKIEEVSKWTRKIEEYVHGEFGGPEQAIKIILCDFFRHGFDGSGADNFFDAGSCVDGRLTSAWNWCSKIEKKKYFPLMLLTGFTGFDGKEGF
eukprot:gene762-1050_t